MPYGISNSYKRGLQKTYSRTPHQHQRYTQPLNDNEDVPRKRIRMDGTGRIISEALPARIQEEVPSTVLPSSITPDAIPSSSTAPSSPRPSFHQNVLSSDPPETSSPPSSPPPALPPSPYKPNPTFSFLKRKRPAAALNEATTAQNQEPLCAITDNRRKEFLPAKKIKQKKAPHMTQMRIDLGGETRKACRVCGMEYIPSNAEDAGLHKEFHAMSVGGVSLGRAFLKEEGLRKEAVVHDVEGGRRLGDGEAVVIVDRKSSVGARNKARKVLEVVNAELSAADIEDEWLWGVRGPSSLKSDGRSKKRRKAGDTAPEQNVDRFKAFLYVDGEKCVGMCLAESISSARCVVVSGNSNTSVARSSCISTSTTLDAASLGISRIWTSKSRRRQGVATALLDCVRRYFFFGMEVPKLLVAFSQPTESGGQLAERWFDAQIGWHVYDVER